MRVDDLNLSMQLKAKLTQAGLTHASDILAAGAAGLEAIDGIGSKTAAEILASVAAVPDEPAPQVSDQGLQRAQPAAIVPDANELITIRNISAEMILVGERYLLPTQTRTVQRRLLRRIPAGKLVEV